MFRTGLGLDEVPSDDSAPDFPAFADRAALATIKEIFDVAHHVAADAVLMPNESHEALHADHLMFV